MREWVQTGKWHVSSRDSIEITEESEGEHGISGRKTGRKVKATTDRDTGRSARDQALSFLEYADRTEEELSRKLKERGYSPAEIQDALSFLLEYHYLDDRAYAERYVRARAGRKSRRQIRAELEQKGIAGELIETALADGTVDEEGQIRRFLEKKGVCSGEETDPRQFRRVTAALARKGFSYDKIRSVIGQMTDNWNQDI